MPEKEEMSFFNHLLSKMLYDMHQKSLPWKFCNTITTLGISTNISRLPCNCLQNSNTLTLQQLHICGVAGNFSVISELSLFSLCFQNLNFLMKHSMTNILGRFFFKQIKQTKHNCFFVSKNALCSSRKGLCQAIFSVRNCSLLGWAD